MIDSAKRFEPYLGELPIGSFNECTYNKIQHRVALSVVQKTKLLSKIYSLLFANLGIARKKRLHSRQSLNEGMFNKVYSEPTLFPI